MRLKSTPGLMLGLLLVGGAGRAESPEDERAAVQERLDRQREALEGLKDQRAETLDVLDALERISRESSARVKVLERQARSLSAEVRVAERFDEMTRAALAAQERRLTPRLVAMYRLSREDRLGLALSAQDFASLVRRAKALATLVERDVEVLEQTQLLARYQRASALHLSRMRASADVRLQALREESALAALRRAAFADLLDEIQAEASRSGRLVKDLEHAEAQLTQLVNELANDGSGTGFRSRKGHMPFPTRGVTEVGFGRVVNPRFNTVTVQKGIDIHAREGAPVVSVGPGTVVFAGWLKGYGNLVIIDHGGGYHTLAAHLAAMQVEPGNEVEEGEVIGEVGDTGSLKGAYLYFEIRHAGEAVDPSPWLNEGELP